MNLKEQLLLLLPHSTEWMKLDGWTHEVPYDHYCVEPVIELLNSHGWEWHWQHIKDDDVGAKRIGAFRGKPMYMDGEASFVKAVAALDLSASTEAQHVFTVDLKVLDQYEQEELNT